MPDETWEAFLIPVDVAFFFRSSAAGRRVIAMYPAPTGATESTLPLDAWDGLCRMNPVLDALTDDVEALLVNRLTGVREYYRVPIDRCYQLVGIIRRNWHGLSGGAAVAGSVAAFFGDLRSTTRPRAAIHA